MHEKRKDHACPQCDAAFGSERRRRECGALARGLAGTARRQQRQRAALAAKLRTHPRLHLVVARHRGDIGFEGLLRRGRAAAHLRRVDAHKISIKRSLMTVVDCLALSRKELESEGAE